MIKLIPNECMKYGALMRLVRRIDDFAFYSLQYSKNGPIIGYDLLKVEKYTPDQLPSNFALHSSNYEAIERLPSNSEWGSKGWSFDKLETAERFLKEVLQNHYENKNHSRAKETL